MKRRAAGEGTVRQRQDGKWEGYTPRDEFGKRKKVIRATQREVLSALATFKAKGQRVDESRGGKQLFRDFLPDWLERIKRPKVRERTYEGYRGTIDNHIVPTFGAMQLARMDDLHIERWHAALYAKHPRTANAAKTILGDALDYALAKGWIEKNPVRSAVLTTTEHPRPIAPLTLEQARALLDIVAGHRLEALYIVALSLGLRRGEVLGLRWDDIDLAKGTVRISGNLQRIGKTLKRGAPKTDASAAVLPLPRPVVLALIRHRERQDVERERLMEIGAWTETGYVFCSTAGTPIEPCNLIRQFKRFLVLAGIRVTEEERVFKDHHGKKRKQLVRSSEVRFHDLRHSCATLLIAQGVHPRVVMQYLRHTRISTTMDLYGHVYEDAHAAAAEQLGVLLDLAPDEDRILELAPREQA